jgi:hypothetical protein
MGSPPGKPPKVGATTRAIESGRFELKCTHCGAQLSLEVTNRIVICEFCGGQTVVPEKLWAIIAPRPTEPPGLVFEPPSPYPPGPTVPHEAPPPAHDTVLPAPRKKSSVLRPFIMTAVIMAFSLGIVVFANLRVQGGCSSLKKNLPSFSSSGNTLDIVPDSAVLPSFGKADPMRTARTIDAVVKKKWVSGAVLAEVNFFKLQADGTIDVGSGSQGLIRLAFYDAPGLASVASGAESLKNGALTVTVTDGEVASVLRDAGAMDLKHVRVLEAFPACGIDELLAAAGKAGYPKGGIANVQFPEVPAAFEESVFKGTFRSVTIGGKEREITSKEREALWNTIGSESWREENVYAYSYRVEGFYPSGQPTLFRLRDCKPVDTEEFKASLLKKYFH